MTNLDSIQYNENRFNFINNFFLEEQFKSFFPDDSIFKDSISIDNENIGAFRNQKFFFNSKIERNNILSFNETISENQIIYSNIGDTSSQNEEKYLINSPSTLSKSKSNQNNEIKLNRVRKNKKEKIFKIQKDNKNIGRIKKNSKYVGKHDKFSEDNLIRKIKGRFLEKCRLAINNEYKKFILNIKQNNSKFHNLLQRITPKVSRKIRKEDNLEWLGSRLCEVFSEEVSVKCSLYNSDYNKKEIKKIFEKNEAKNVISLLNKPVKEMYDAFIYNKKIWGFSNLDDDVEELRKKLEKENDENIEEYLKKYKNTALNLEEIFVKKSPRNN